MKFRIINNLLLKRYLSSRSNLRPFLAKRPMDKSFWHFHDSIHFKGLTFRNENYENCELNQCHEMVIRKQLSDSIIKNPNHVITDSVHQFSLQTKLYVLDTIAIVHGTDHKSTITYFDGLRPQIIFELQKHNIYVLMQLLYFSSVITTENRDDYNFMISKIIDRIETFFSKEDPTYLQLCSADIAVLCHSLFKLKIKLKTILNLFSNLVSEDIKNNKLSKSHVISIVKYMRFNEYSDERLSDAIKGFIKNNSNQYSFLECAHFLAFFANVSLYDTDVYRYLVDERASQLLEVDSVNLLNGEKLRSKDLARFLWSVSIVNHKLNQNLINKICQHIENLMSTDFVIYPHFLLDCLKSLIVLGIYPQKILLNSLNSKKFSKLFVESKREKTALDLYFILESIAIERPSIKLEKRTFLYTVAKQPNNSIKFECKHRPQLLKFRNLINRYQNANQINVELSYILPHIGIASLVVNGTSLEVIDSTVSSSTENVSKHLNGLMQTKLRQMDKRDISYKLIYNSQDLDNFFETNKCT